MHSTAYCSLASTTLTDLGLLVYPDFFWRGQAPPPPPPPPHPLSIPQKIEILGEVTGPLALQRR